VCLAQNAREELLWQNPLLMTTATQFGRGKPSVGIRRFRHNGDGPSNAGCNEDTGIVEMG